MTEPTIFAQYLTPRTTVWKHDRSLTVGASEIGACARQVWMKKNGIVEEGERRWGFTERGHVVEEWVIKTLRANGVKVAFCQKTLSSGYLSATLDGVVGNTALDVKSFDPRKNRVVEPKHIMQVQVQIGLWNAKWKTHKLDKGVLLYVNASDFQDIREHVVERDPAVFLAAYQRAEWIMTTRLAPPREGHITGGNECRMCPYQTECLGAPIEDKGMLSEADMAAVEIARNEIKIHEALVKKLEAAIAAEKEQIREILRAADAKRAPGLARISRSQRTTLDQEEMERDGIDLSKYRRASRETETVTVE